MIERDFPVTPAERDASERLRSRMNVGRLLVRWRVKLGLTQEQLASKAGTKQSRISEIETLQGNVRFDTLDNVTRAMGLEITLQPRYDRRTGSVLATTAGTTDRPLAPVHGAVSAGSLRVYGERGARLTFRALTVGTGAT